MLDETRKADFERDGYLVLENLIDADTLAAVRADYAARLAELCRDWCDRGLLAPDIPTRSFDEQILAATDAGIDWFQPLDISLPNFAFEPDVPMFPSAAVFRMIRDGRLLDTVESLLGPEIESNPIQHVRIKPPLARTTAGESRAHVVGTDWHQDRAVSREEADATRMVTVWIAVGDATVDNGCLQVIPGSHRGAMRTHCPARQLGIPAADIDPEQARPLPVGAGGAVLFHPLTVHGSLENRGDGIRWSFDLRYHVTGQPSGRPQFPAFVARSRANPADELTDPLVWADLWWRTRERVAAGSADERFNRWDGSQPVCA